MVVFVTWDWPGPDGIESQSGVWEGKRRTGHIYPVNQIIRNEGDKTDPPKHLGHFCPALFRCVQPLSLSHPFAISFQFEATILDLKDVSYQHASHAAVKANPNFAAGETHFNLRLSPRNSKA
ncbi:hypothetical protein FEM48_Zijuj03G0082300 [Ziziphus jujuba var. spinosa]|uniref:Uncharacterized protein n=1 Tax=Ziziphus jujuba var. spinosa TaxID=714518 RepID=A0A978VP66_ZIZJJ|nr:hypothetical protein FEM48_Zijuj03G0082300 [Ziziphus jujuba var. spinosa]